MELKSVLGRKDVLALAFGAIVGWGWVVLAGSLIEQAGTVGSMLAFLVGALLVGSVGLTYAELTSALPRAGGELAFTYRALGPTWSWVCGWSLILAYVGVCAFEAVAIATVFNYLFPNLRLGYLYSVAGSEVYLSWIVVGVGSAVFVAIINWLGIKTSALVQWTATTGLLVVGALFFLGSNLFGETANLQPSFTSSTGFLQVVILTPFLMMGFDVIPQTAEEINIPQKQMGRLILFSIFLATAWYVLVQWGVGLSLPAEARQASELATADAAARVFNFPPAASILVLGGLLGILTSWNAFFVGATRLLFGMARAKMLPGALAHLHKRYQTPTFGILFITVCSLVAPFLGRKALVWVADAASLGIVVAYFLVSISFLRLRWREPEMPRPYRLRHGTLAGSLAVAISFGFLLLYLPFSPSALVWPHEWAIVLGWIGLGIVAFVTGKRIYPSIDRAEQERIIFGRFGRELEKQP
jgi:amino acid transporter